MSQALGQGTFTRDYATAASSKDAKGGYPRFYVEAEKDEAASIENGRDIYREVEMVEIIIPSVAQYNKPVQRVRPDHIARWPAQYEAFKKGLEAPLDGTPLEEWNVLNRSALLELKSLHFRTIEDVAEMTDLGIQRLGMMGRGLKLKAAAWLDQAEKNRITNAAIEQNAKMENALAERDAQISRLNEQIAALGEQMRGLVEQRTRPIEQVMGRDPAPPLTMEPPRQSALAKFAAIAAQSPQDRVDATRRELAQFDQVGPDTGAAENLVTKRRPGRPRKVEQASA